MSMLAPIAGGTHGRGDDHAIAESHAGVDPVLANALAAELESLTGRLSDLAYELGSDDDTLRRHMTSLQAIDLITQVQLGIADILRSTACVEERVAGVTLQGLSDSLRAAVARG